MLTALTTALLSHCTFTDFLPLMNVRNIWVNVRTQLNKIIYNKGVFTIGIFYAEKLHIISLNLMIEDDNDNEDPRIL